MADRSRGYADEKPIDNRRKKPDEDAFDTVRKSSSKKPTKNNRVGIFKHAAPVARVLNFSAKNARSAIAKNAHWLAS